MNFYRIFVVNEFVMNITFCRIFGKCEITLFLQDFCGECVNLIYRIFVVNV